MAEIYKCIKGFEVENYDIDGFGTGEFTVVAAGSLWERDNSTDIIGGEVHLDSMDFNKWLEITADRLSKYFEPVADQPKLSGHFEKRFLEVT